MTMSGGLENLSDAAQDYLREIYKLQGDTGRVRTSTLARRMGVSAPSATAMVKKLASLALADHQPYRGVRLTPTGERFALEVLRHHRLLELYLAQTLEVGLDAVHAEADRLEHALSEELEVRIDAALGSPRQDPHGDPIPDARLRLSHSPTRPLRELEPGEQATIRQVPDRDDELLRYLGTLGLVPGRVVELLQAAPFGGPVALKANGGEIAISPELAAEIRVA
jgi:DtxR family transcriptional regulator, Mn-dependent transcriptional regulator